MSMDPLWTRTRVLQGAGGVYLAGMLQGLVLVSIPASAAVLKGVQGLSNAQYGAVFLPQVVMAVLGSILGGSLARTLGLRGLLALALTASGLSQFCLAASAIVPGGLSFAAVLFSTSLLGLGFGLAGAPLNGYPGRLFPSRQDSALVGLHSFLGLGLALGPLLAAFFIRADAWIGFPMVLGLLSFLSVVVTLNVPLPAEGQVARNAARQKAPTNDLLFWAYAMIAVLYAFAEGTFSSWAVVYLHEGLGVQESSAGLALSVFWGALVVGRIVISILVARFDPVVFWLGLPVLMAGTFLLLPMARGAVSGVVLFGCAGLATSAFFPLTITLVARSFPAHVAWVSSMMIAALMVGVGLGSFTFGPLREWLSFAALYRLSAIYPLLALVLAVFVARSSRCRRGKGRVWGRGTAYKALPSTDS